MVEISNYNTRQTIMNAEIYAVNIHAAKDGHFCHISILVTAILRAVKHIISRHVEIVYQDLVLVAIWNARWTVR